MCAAVGVSAVACRRVGVRRFRVSHSPPIDPRVVVCRHIPPQWTGPHYPNDIPRLLSDPPPVLAATARVGHDTRHRPCPPGGTRTDVLRAASIQLVHLYPLSYPLHPLVEVGPRELDYKAAQPRSSEKNAASRAGQTPCTRWAVTLSLLEQKACVTAENRAFEEKQPLVFLPKAAIMVE